MTDKIEKQIELKAPLTRVWQALTDHEQFGQWFGVRLDGPFEAGQASTGFMTYPGYEHVRWNARTVAIEPMSRFAFRWHPYAMDASIDYSGEPMTLIEFRLEASGDGTRLTVTESGFDALPASRRDEAFRMNDHGWGQQMKNIAAHVDA